MTTIHDLLFVMDAPRAAPIDETPADPQPPPVARRRRLVEKRPPPSDVTPTWPGGERYATDYADILAPNAS